MQGPVYHDFSWQAGYGAFSVSGSQCGQVRNYILQQEQHHRKVSFKEEYLLFLTKNKIEFDERYLWD
jgi:hypothetical protein